MLTAILTDLHGNREALDACLVHAARAGAERYIFLGDLVGYGADPAYVVDTVARYAERGAIVLLGNHDQAVGGSCEGFNADARVSIEWTRTRLDTAQAAFLAGLPLRWEEGDRLYVHANAWAPAGWEYIQDSVAAERSMRRTERRITFCGHTHRPALFHIAEGHPAAPFKPVSGVAIPLTLRRRWLAVIGAVGQPRDEVPAACYALLRGGTDSLTYVRVPYETDRAARKIMEAGLPQRLASRLLVGR